MIPCQPAFPMVKIPTFLKQCALVASANCNQLICHKECKGGIIYLAHSYKITSPGQVQLKPQHPGSRQMGYSILMDRNQKGVIRGATVRHNPQGHASFNPAPPTRPVAHSSPLHTFHSGFESILGLTQSLTESETL